MSTRVVNKKREPFDVDITRNGKWGNPFVVGKHGSRNDVIELFRIWLPRQPTLMAQLHELKGKRLGCVCKPKACHGDVLVELLEGSEPSQLELFYVSQKT